MQRKVNYNDMELKDTILLLLMVAVLLFSVIYTLVKIMQIRAMTSNYKLDVNEVVRVGKTDKNPVLYNIIHLYPSSFNASLTSDINLSE